MNDYNNSRPLDVHVWSEHPQINDLVDKFWFRFFQEDRPVKMKRGPKPKASQKKHLKVLLLDLFVCWKSDSSMYLAVHMSKSGWKANSRYNALHLSSQMIEIIKKLKFSGFLEFQVGYEGRLSRIRASEALRSEFSSIDVQSEDISFNFDQEMLVLKSGNDFVGSNKGAKLEYTDTPQTFAMRDVLRRYNLLLKNNDIDLCSAEYGFVDRIISKGKSKGRSVRIHTDKRNIFVKRVFNNSSWELGGRFYGGWWQFILRELRKDIMINDKPTVEIDYKAMHIALLFSEVGYGHDFDPYSLDTLVYAEFKHAEQRQIIKGLILMALNATSRDKAFQAFRGDQPTGDPFNRLKNAKLAMYLDAFIQKYPLLEQYLCTGKGLALMHRESCIAEYVHTTG